MSQIEQPKLVECNRCKTNGFPGVKIGFQRTDKRKPDGKMVWLLINPDLSGHTHIEPSSTNIMDKIPQLENDKPQPRPPMSSSSDNEQLTQEEIGILKQFVALLKVIKCPQ